MTEPTEKKTPTDIVLIAKEFGLKGPAAIKEVKALTPADKEQLGSAIRSGSMTY